MGMIRKASFTSIFPSNVLGPSCSTVLAMLSMDMYDSEQSAFSMPSLTLWPSGAERSTISLHFPGLCFLGMIPIGLEWNQGRVLGLSMHIRRPKDSSLSMYASTTAGWSDVESKFLDFCFNAWL